jgi:glutathione reductase (NADPH)
MPPRVLFVGGGYVSFEFAHVAARAGAQVTILHRGTRPLEGFDPDLVGMLMRRSREAGIQIEVGLDVRAVDAAGDRLVVRGVQQGVEKSFATDLAVHGAGRVPDLDDLDLAAGGVTREKGGVTVNQYLQSVSNPAVYAGGDAAASGPPLTPKADHDVGVLVTNLLEGNKRSPNYEGIASAVFTIPPLASVGLTEEGARKTGRRFRVTHQDTAGWFNTRRVGETASGFKVLIDEETDHILGAHLLGPRADEVINLFAIAVRLRIPARELQQVICAYPTYSSDVHYML